MFILYIIYIYILYIYTYTYIYILYSRQSNIHFINPENLDRENPIIL